MYTHTHAVVILRSLHNPAYIGERVLSVKDRARGHQPSFPTTFRLFLRRISRRPRVHRPAWTALAIIYIYTRAKIRAGYSFGRISLSREREPLCSVYSGDLWSVGWCVCSVNDLIARSLSLSLALCERARWCGWGAYFHARAYNRRRDVKYRSVDARPVYCD